MTESPSTSSGRPAGGTAQDENFSFSGDTGESGSGTESSRQQTAREWVAQLQAMIDNVATHAAPVMRDVAIKAAELAAVAGEKAGPIAQRAAEVTAQAGTKVAERSREVAAELRRDAGKDGGTGTTGGGAGASTAGSRSGSGSEGIDSVGE